MNKFYLHTLNGSPGFYDGKQICYMGQRSKNCLVESLEQIKAEQQLSKEWRDKKKFFTKMVYDYVLVTIPTD